MVLTATRAHAVCAAERLAEALRDGRAFMLPTADRRMLLHAVTCAVGPDSLWRLADALRRTAVQSRDEADRAAERAYAASLRGYAAECDRIARRLHDEADNWPR